MRGLASHPTLREVVTERIAEAIVRGELAPGERLGEIQLAEQLGVSRSPIREALRQLSVDGLVTSEPRKGMTVATIEPGEVTHFYDCRILLSRECVRLAVANIDDEQMQALEAVFDQLEAAAAGNRLHEYLQTVSAFQETYEEACPNRVLVELLRGIWRRAMRFRSVSIRREGRMAESLQHHRALLETFRSRDAQAAEGLLERMLQDSRDAILASLRDEAAADGKDGRPA
jgi:DNA-binding GntR family transcriptional regulator